MNTWRAALAVLVLAVALTSCGVTAGRVDALTVEPAHTNVEEVSSVQIGQVTVPIYAPVDYPEAYRVDLRTAEGETGSLYVDRAVFDSLVVGQYADFGES